MSDEHDKTQMQNSRIETFAKQDSANAYSSFLDEKVKHNKIMNILWSILFVLYAIDSVRLFFASGASFELIIKAIVLIAIVLIIHTTSKNSKILLETKEEISKRDEESESSLDTYSFH